ncbi:MAG: epoxyqueuosine reductase QueH [Leptospirales bacterium]|nr:epoxyqueuosine reductase QueH [Leptospirales bacterium]
MCYVYELLKDSFDVVSYFFNPNISPEAELNLRLNELRRFSAMKGFTLIESAGETDEWLAEVSPLAGYGERSARCFACFRYRLRAAFEKASELGIDTVATSLSISPHKDADMINKAGAELSGAYSADFYQADFKKKDGYKKSVELSRMYGFYRQNYCGCIFSKNERGY